MESSDKPTDKLKYLARDGRYYNGYMGSSDAAEDLFGDVFKEMAELVKKDLQDYLDED